MLPVKERYQRISLAFAALLRFYQGEWRVQLSLKDEPAIGWTQSIWQSDVSLSEKVKGLLSNADVWAQT
jgi:hypothetical protein